MMQKFSMVKCGLALALVAGSVVFSLDDASAACLRNQSNKTVYASLTSGVDGGRKVGNLIIGETFCVPAGEVGKVTVKVNPYAGSRMGCKIQIVGDENMDLVRFGTMNNCVFVPN